MSNKDLHKGKHLRIEDRIIIEYGLEQNYTLKGIAGRVKKIQLPYLRRLREIDLLKQTSERKMIYKHVNIEKIALR